MMKCTVCFESATGLRSGDHFVSTNNGHVFHYCCVLEYVAGGSYFCPMCDEDLRLHPFVRINSKGVPLPARPPKPARATKAAAATTVTVKNNANSSGHSSPPTLPSTTSNDPWFLDGLQTAAVNSLFPGPSYRAEPDYIFKIVVLGDINVGKSSLLQRYADDRFDPIIRTTAGCDLRVKALQIAGKVVRLNLWDTAGQERHRAVVDMYLRRADGIIFCFDITDTASFLSLQGWHQFALRSLSKDTLKIIVGTKSDLWNHRKVKSQQIRNLAESWGAQYIYTSAKDAVNVEVVFRSLAALILENRLPTDLNCTSTLPSAPFQEPKEHQGIIRLSRAENERKQKKRKKSGECC